MTVFAGNSPIKGYCLQKRQPKDCFGYTMDFYTMTDKMIGAEIGAVS